MLTFQEIEVHLSSIPEYGPSAVTAFQEIQQILGLYKYPIDQLGLLLHAVESILPLVEGFDSKNSNVWAHWLRTSQEVQRILESSSIVPGTPPPLSLKDIFTKKFPIATCLIANGKNGISGLLPAKAILLSAHRRFYTSKRSELGYGRSSERISTEQMLSCLIAKSSVYGEEAERILPPWPAESFSKWKEAFLEIANELPKDGSYRTEYGQVADHFVLLRIIRRTLIESTCHEAEVSHIQEPDSGPPSKRRQTGASILTQPTAPREACTSGDPKPRRFTFAYCKKPSIDEDLNLEALSPTIIQATAEAETPSDQPTLLPEAQSLDIRYSNYRTAMDNQRLPWQWDSLNAFELKALLAAITPSKEKLETSLSERNGALILWFLLATGQTIEQILQFRIGSSDNMHSGIIAGSTYLRHIALPPHAFTPNPQQRVLLHEHSQHLSLALPTPFTALIKNAGLTGTNNSQRNEGTTIGDVLKLDIEHAEKAARAVLESHRTRSLRLLPGRIRNVLPTEVMRLTNDPVATHLLAALPTDPPPSGVYYTSYSKEHLERIYAAAVSRILGGGA